MSENNPFRAAVNAKKVLTSLYPDLPVVIVLGPSGPYLEVGLSTIQPPGSVNGFRVVSADAL